MNKDIGEKIKQLRKSKKRTLKEVSEQMNLSISFLSQVERLKCSLTLESLKKISDALNVNPSYFFSDYDEPTQSMVIRGFDNDLDTAMNQFIYKDLSGNKNNLGFNPILIVLNPNENKGNPFSHIGNEFLYVLEGELTVLIDNDEFFLNANDSIIIDANHPHYWLNRTDQPVKFLCISSENR